MEELLYGTYMDYEALSGPKLRVGGGNEALQSEHVWRGARQPIPAWAYT